MGGVIGFDFDLTLFVGLVEGSTLLARAAVGSTAAGSTVGSTPVCLPLNLGRPLALVSAAFAAFSRLVNGCGARISGIAAGSSFGAEFAFRSRAAFRVALSFSPLALKNLPLTDATGPFSDFLILPLPDDGGGLPSGAGAMPAGVSGGPGSMCITNSFFAP
jgi:hypothetical protein